MLVEKEFRVWIACEYSDTVTIVCAKNELQARLRFLVKYRLKTGDNSVLMAMVMAEAC